MSTYDSSTIPDWNAAVPELIPNEKALAMHMGSCYLAIAVFTNTASNPNSIA